MDLARLGQDEAERPGIAGQQPAVLDQGAVDQPPLQDVLRRLQPRSRETVDTRRARLQVARKSLGGAPVYQAADFRFAFTSLILFLASGLVATLALTPSLRRIRQAAL